MGLVFRHIQKSLSQSVVQIFVEHWGDNLQFYPNFALFLTLGDEPRPTIFFRRAN